MSFPHCPNKACNYHQGPTPTLWYKYHGSYTAKAFGTVPRYRCLCCGSTFSAQTFSIDYYAKTVLNYQKILEELGTGPAASTSPGSADAGSKPSSTNSIASAAARSPFSRKPRNT
jgi:hypothetical protein